MDRLTRLREARDSYAVRLREVVRIFSLRPSALVCIFEGEDEKYYGPRLDMMKPGLEWESVNCGGKDVVIKLWHLLSANTEYSDARAAYFVDQDFDRSRCPVARNVYVTPCYSIENLYVTEAVAKRVLRSEFGLGELPDEDGTFARCVSLFRDRLAEFLDAIALVNAWILFHRQIETQDRKTPRLNVSSVAGAQLISISLQAVTARYTVGDLEKLAVNVRPVSEEQLAEIVKSFKHDERIVLFRGKFQAYFMRLFLTQLRDDAGSETPNHFPSKRRVPFTVSDRNFLSDLSQYAETPACLRAFVEALT